ncbi:MAG: hypothetical protein ACYS8K_10385, partial [Planctomycetota bacterium]
MPELGRQIARAPSAIAEGARAAYSGAATRGNELVSGLQWMSRQLAGRGPIETQPPEPAARGLRLLPEDPGRILEAAQAGMYLSEAEAAAPLALYPAQGAYDALSWFARSTNTDPSQLPGYNALRAYVESAGPAMREQRAYAEEVLGRPDISVLESAAGGLASLPAMMMTIPTTGKLAGVQKLERLGHAAQTGLAFALDSFWKNLDRGIEAASESFFRGYVTGHGVGAVTRLRPGLQPPATAALFAGMAAAEGAPAEQVVGTGLSMWPIAYAFKPRPARPRGPSPEEIDRMMEGLRFLGEEEAAAKPPRKPRKRKPKAKPPVPAEYAGLPPIEQTPPGLQAIVRKFAQMTPRDLQGEIARMPRELKDEIDSWLVDIRHPQYLQPGTTEGRIARVAREYHRAAQRPEAKPPAAPEPAPPAARPPGEGVDPDLGPVWVASYDRFVSDLEAHGRARIRLPAAEGLAEVEIRMTAEEGGKFGYERRVPGQEPERVVGTRGQPFDSADQARRVAAAWVRSRIEDLEPPAAAPTPTPPTPTPPAEPVTPKRRLSPEIWAQRLAKKLLKEAGADPDPGTVNDYAGQLQTLLRTRDREGAEAEMRRQLGVKPKPEPKAPAEPEPEAPPVEPEPPPRTREFPPLAAEGESATAMRERLG